MKRLFLTVWLCVLTASLTFAGHTILNLRLGASAIYRGAAHNVKVSVPDSYHEGDTAAIFFGFDGILCNAPEVLDSLMATGDIPTTIGIYLEPGQISDRDGNVLRYNRSNEFDATDARMATFIESEVLPAVESLKTDDGRSIQLSRHGADNTIFGLSSGGIAAFTVAWHRPDLFGHVFSGCGTFVPMRGGDNLAALIRKAEPKPIKIFLEDGTEDCWNPIFGSWFEANQIMAGALQFAGYDIDTFWHPGGHSVNGSNAIFGKVIKWLMSDYPAEIPIRSSNNEFLQKLMVESDDWQMEEGFNYMELPAPGIALYPDNSLVARADIANSNYLSQSILDEYGNMYYTQPFYWLHTYDNSTLLVGGMAFDGDGNLWVLTDAGIQICDQNGRVRVILSLPAFMPNDIIPLTALILDDGQICLVAPMQTYTRKIGVTRPTPNKRPESQGQG